MSYGLAEKQTLLSCCQTNWILQAVKQIVRCCSFEDSKVGERFDGLVSQLYVFRFELNVLLIEDVHIHCWIWVVLLKVMCKILVVHSVVHGYFQMSLKDADNVRGIHLLFVQLMGVSLGADFCPD